MARKADDDDSTVIPLTRARSSSRPPTGPAAPEPDVVRVSGVVLDHLPGERAVLAADGRVVNVNRAWSEAAPDCLIGTDFFRTWRWGSLDPRDAAHLIAGIRSAISGSTTFAHHWHAPGGGVDFVASALGGDRGGAVISVLNAADRPSPLTALGTRSRFLARLADVLAERDAATVHVLAVRVLGYDLVNQAYGHDIGDLVLLEVGERLATVAGSDTNVGHLGGGEFALLARNRSARIAASVTEELRQPFRAGGNDVHLGARVGCRVIRSGECESAEAVLRDAVATMGEASLRAGDGIAFFTDQTAANVTRKVTLGHELRRAVADDALGVEFQPLVDVTTGRVCGAETLVRWQHHELGAVPASEFVPIAESTGLIHALGECVLRRGIAAMAAWKAAGASPGVVSVNLSPLQLADPGLVPVIFGLLEEHGVAPSELCLELTESGLLATAEHGIGALHELRAAGATVALDDFGTGHSSLGRLKEVPVDVLKLDRSFVIGLGGNPQDDAIVSAVIALARSLGLRTVAEGVETELHARHVVALGCTVVQGWLYSPAVSADVLPELCRRGFPLLPTAQIHP